MPDEFTAIRDAQVAEEIAAQAGTDSTPALFLNPGLTPVIFGPQRPPLASSGYYPGAVGIITAAVALNFSNCGIFVEGTNTLTMVRVNSVKITNPTAGVLDYTIRRLDDASGFTVVDTIPAYISAGSPATRGVRFLRRNNITTLSGVAIAGMTVFPNSVETFDGPFLLNNGGLIVTPTVVDTEVRCYMNYEAWPAIRRQPIPG